MAASNELEPSIRDGWLYMNSEESGSLDSWKKFFFRYTSNGLYWYKSDPTSVTNLLKEDNLQPLGHVPKAQIRGAARVVTDKKFSFKMDVALSFDTQEAPEFYERVAAKSPRGDRPSSISEASLKSRMFYGSSTTDRDIWVATLQGKELKLDDCKGFVIRVIQGKNLAARDSNGLSDPFCTLIHPLTKKELKTSVIPKTLSPKWDESLIMYIKDLSGVEHIKAQVWDKDRIGKDFMGEFSIPLPKASKDEQETWHDLQTRPKEKAPVTGSILVQIMRDPHITE